MSVVHLKYVLGQHAAPLFRFSARARRTEPTFTPIRHHLYVVASFARHQLKSLFGIPAISKFRDFLLHYGPDLFPVFGYEGFPMLMLIKKNLM
jgi:hypothetical protein